jgi:AcrR family transcriptional regulator
MKAGHSEVPRTTTRERLLDEAAAILDLHGQDAVTMRSVAQKVGVSAMASYKHFPDKQALLVAVATRGFQAIANAMDRRVTATADPKQKLEEVMAAYVEFGTNHPARYKLMYGREISAAKDPHFATIAISVFDRIEGAIAECLTEKATDQSSVSLAGIMLACAHGAIDLHGQGHVSEKKGLGDPERLVKHLIAMLPISI